MLDVFARGLRLTVAPGAAQHQPHGDTGDGGVHPAVLHQAPDDQGERDVDVPAADTLAQQQIEDHQAGDGQAERQKVDLRGEEDRDDQDREEVVDDGEGEQEGAQRGGQGCADHGEYGEREGDVGGGGDRPALERAAADAVDREVDDRRHRHPAERGDHGESGGLGVTELAGDQFALELDTGDEEEDREQPVGGPVLEGQVQAQRGRSQVEAADRLVALAEGVCPDQSGYGGGEEEDAADGFGA